MNGIVKVEKRRVIEGEVVPPFGLNGGKQMQEAIIYREWNPYPELRALGYTANPDICRHGRKGWTPRDGWWCKDCGDLLTGPTGNMGRI